MAQAATRGGGDSQSETSSAANVDFLRQTPRSHDHIVRKASPVTSNSGGYFVAGTSQGSPRQGSRSPLSERAFVVHQDLSSPERSDGSHAYLMHREKWRYDCVGTPTRSPPRSPPLAEAVRKPRQDQGAPPAESLYVLRQEGAQMSSGYVLRQENVPTNNKLSEEAVYLHDNAGQRPLADESRVLQPLTPPQDTVYVVRQDAVRQETPVVKSLSDGYTMRQESTHALQHGNVQNHHHSDPFGEPQLYYAAPVWTDGSYVDGTLRSNSRDRRGESLGHSFANDVVRTRPASAARPGFGSPRPGVGSPRPEVAMPVAARPVLRRNHYDGTSDIVEFAGRTPRGGPTGPVQEPQGNTEYMFSLMSRIDPDVAKEAQVEPKTPKALKQHPPEPDSCSCAPELSWFSRMMACSSDRPGGHHRVRVDEVCEA